MVEPAGLKTRTTLVVGAIMFVVLVVLFVLVAIIARGGTRGGARGGARSGVHGHRQRQAGCIVVDTLNLVYWLRGEPARRGAPDAAEIASAVEYSAPRLRAALAQRAAGARRAAGASPGVLARVVFVVKDVSPPLGAAGWARVAAAARRARADLEVVFASAKVGARAPPRRGESAEVRHARRGADDVYAAFRAAELGCAVASNDSFADFHTVCAVAPPMSVLVFDPFTEPSAPPARRIFDAAALSPARRRRVRPVGVRFDELLNGTR